MSIVSKKKTNLVKEVKKNMVYSYMIILGTAEMSEVKCVHVNVAHTRKHIDLVQSKRISQRHTL